MSPIVDSALTFENAIAGTSAPQAVIDTLVLVDVEYLSFDGLLHRGQIVVHTAAAADVCAVFQELRERSFPIEKVIPVVAYDWDDEASMADNNSSAFNYRRILETDRLSNHSFGLALDINPRLNPFISRSKKIYPKGAVYDPNVPGTFRAGDDAVRAFVNRGWYWGGAWQSVVDWQHFERTSLALKR